MTASITISIINYRTKELTINCVNSVLDQIKGTNCKIVVVDNASGDGSIEAVESWLSEREGSERVTVVKSETNSGFSGGHNIGMAHDPESDFFLILNSDAILKPGFIENILNAAQRDGDVGFFAPRIVYEGGESQDSCFRFHSPLSELDRAARTGLITKLVKNSVVSLGKSPKNEDIEWASFACILLRGDMVRELGPMDDGYFLYFEDVEYCLRARRAGWKIRYETEAQILHYRGGSGPVKSLTGDRKRLPTYFYASRTRFLYQAHGRMGLLAANLLWYVGRLVAQTARLRRGRYNPPALKEHIDIWTNFFDPLGPDHRPQVAK